MHSRQDRRLRLLALGLGAAVALTACGGGGSSSPTAPKTSGALTGLLAITAGTCKGGTPAGSYFRMISPGGKPGVGPFVKNGDSTCSDKNYSLMEPGTDGGLKLGSFQDFPAKAFDAKGNGLVDTIIKPVTFFGITFALACAGTDAQTKAATKAPTLTADAAGKVTGTISCWQAAYNNAYYNQGAPKPDGSTPGFTSPQVTGTYDKATGKVVLDWASQIAGGAFNNFGGSWHLEGTLKP